jgi:HPt (histidine-containing phosphotransfer) domain-containing protein
MRKARLDSGALQQLRGLPVKIRLRLFELYTRDAPALVTALQEGLSKGDVGAVQAAAHRLKSSSASVGATDLADLCKRLEGEARNRRFEAPDECAQRLQCELQRAMVALADLRGELG